ncbi:MAG: (2Fe-2S)-binding protein, partial [Spirochaetae bacterium HGW-Spirochaetae-8]
VLSALQAAFDRNNAVQCGFCTSGMIISAKELIHNHPKPSVEEIKEGIEGNFCRCTGYQQIIEAILEATGQKSEKEGMRYAGK